ncbi:MAG: hypothetical protein V8T36_08185 [Ruthenibacterium lactatiformans]
MTVNATLLDETGALQSLLAGISGAGASIVTINQATPENGTAQVAVSIRTGGMRHLEDSERCWRTVVDIRRGSPGFRGSRKQNAEGARPPGKGE